MVTASTNELHGGNIYKAAAQYQIPSASLLDFSANINPLGIPAELKRLLTANLDNLIHYPDPAATNLRRNIGRYLDVPAAQIIPGNGASEIIFLLLATLRPKKVLLCAPTFAEYAKAAAAAGVVADYFPLAAAEGFQLRLASFLARARDCDCIFLCNPNNPTSGLLEQDSLVDLLEHTGATGTTVIIDEAFIELTVGGNRNSAVDLAAKYPHLFIIRAFTKIFAVPGLRLGYGIGAPGLVTAMWARKLPWSVNLLADSVGEYLAQAGEFLDATAAWLRAEKEWFYERLGEIAKLEPYPPQTNFILLQLLDRDQKVAALQDKLARRGILIRDASNFETLNEQFFRLAIRSRADNQRLLAELQEVLAEST